MFMKVETKEPGQSGCAYSARGPAQGTGWLLTMILYEDHVRPYVGPFIGPSVSLQAIYLLAQSDYGNKAVNQND